MSKPYSSRLELRPLGAIHAAFVEALYGHPDVTRTLLRIQRAISREEACAFCQTSSAASGEYRCIAVLRANDQPVGLGNLSMHSLAVGGVANLGYSVLPAFWRQGIATELAALLVDFAYRRLGAVEVHATTLHGNVASARVLEKLRFTIVDANGRETDSRGDERQVLRWSLPKQT